MRFYTSDLHFGHQNILNYGRKFSSVDEMNVALVDNWNSVVGPEDTVYVIGDFAMGKIADTLPLADLLNGTKILIVGNHDRPFKLKGREKWEAEYSKYFDVIYGELVVDFFPYTTKLCHFPYTLDHTKDVRYPEHRPQHTTEFLLFGHLHSKWQYFPDKSLHIGSDAWNNTPVAEDQVIHMMENYDEGFARTQELRKLANDELSTED